MDVRELVLLEETGDLPELLHLEPAQIFRCPNGVEKRRLTKYGHGVIPILHAGTFVRQEKGCTVSAQRGSIYVVLVTLGASPVSNLDCAPERSV